MGSQKVRHDWATFTSLHFKDTGEKILIKKWKIQVRHREAHYQEVKTDKRLPRWPSGKTIHLPRQETQEPWVQSLDQEDPLEEEMGTHPSILPWEIPRTGKPSRLQSVGSQRVRHDLATEHAAQRLVNIAVGHLKINILWCLSHKKFHLPLEDLPG